MQKFDKNECCRWRKGGMKKDASQRESKSSLSISLAQASAQSFFGEESEERRARENSRRKKLHMFEVNASAGHIGDSVCRTESRNFIPIEYSKFLLTLLGRERHR